MTDANEAFRGRRYARAAPSARVARCAAIVVALAIAIGCGDGGNGNEGGPSLPDRQDPQFGTAGNVLGTDLASVGGDSAVKLWVGFNREDRWQEFLGLTEQLGSQNSRPYVGGRVVADPSREQGFYFDPDTTTAAEVVAGGFQTTLEVLRNAPESAAAAGHPWMVALVAERIVPSE